MATLQQRYELFIRTSPDTLWNAITRPETTPHYFYGSALHAKLETGAPLKFTMPDGSVMVEGEVLQARPREEFSHTWIIRYDPSCSNERSKVRYRIDARGEVCKLTVEHDLSEAPLSAAQVGGEGGWSVVLSGLKTFLETGKAMPMPQT
ncbi:MAG: SRPBCC domain-containing protein [Deltaproteobacteria bacterium]|nr:SRPBCC domain-containing protein [Deltaproteobacteria bacterium]